MFNSLASLPWWYQSLIISSLVLFNSFCFIGTIAGIYSIVILANINRATKVTTVSVLNKLDDMQTNLAEWSWLAAPIGAIVSGAFLGRKKNVAQSGLGMIGDILKKVLK
jgi:hypothetical protein